MPITTAYSIDDVSFVLDGLQLVGNGLGEGDDAINIEQVEDVGSMTVGADGSSVFSQHAGRAATITIKLLHTSAAHRRLTDLEERQRNGQLDGFSVLHRDARTNEGGQADRAYIQGRPSIQAGMTATEREWVLVTGDWRNTPLDAVAA